MFSRVVIFAAVLITSFGIGQILMLWLFNRPWWKNKIIRRLSLWLPVVGILAVLGWAAGDYHARDWLSYPSAFTAVLVFVLEAGLILSLPISGIIHFINYLVDRVIRRVAPHREAEPVNQNRRLVLKGIAAVAPVLALSGSTGGLVRAFGNVRVYERPMGFATLPDELVGLRLLHISDIHLRHYVTLDHLEQTLETARQFRPDLVLVTGDIADDLYQLPEALEMINGLNAPYGTFATLGNHEYFRGIERVRSIFDKSPVPLFVNQGQWIPIKSSGLYLAGIDDPRHMGQLDESFFKRTIDTAMADSPRDQFSVLMSHRPNAFTYASSQGIDLTLAGHTHGGQLGLFGRSVFESFAQDKYLWGHYSIELSHLYTSSGMGHWFPFRLGCPPEAPVIVLQKSAAAAREAA